VRDSTAPVSVIIPCLNAAKTLPAAIHSVLSQTARDRGLVIDDKSTDHSAAVAAAFDPRVRVLMNPSRGPGRARRLGVEQARGEYIAFVDADDTVESTSTRSSSPCSTAAIRTRWCTPARWPLA